MEPFWMGGKRSYLKALALEEAAEVARVKKVVMAENDGAGEMLEQKIRRVRAKYAKKRRDAENGLY